MNAFDPKRFTVASDGPALSERPGCGPKVPVTSHFHADSNMMFSRHAAYIRRKGRERSVGRVSCRNGMQADTTDVSDLTGHADGTKT